MLGKVPPPSPPAKCAKTLRPKPAPVLLADQLSTRRGSFPHGGLWTRCEKRVQPRIWRRSGGATVRLMRAFLFAWTRFSKSGKPSKWRRIWGLSLISTFPTPTTTASVFVFVLCLSLRGSIRGTFQQSERSPKTVADRTNSSQARPGRSPSASSPREGRIFQRRKDALSR